MTTLAELKEFSNKKTVADVLGKNTVWLWRRRHIPIYAATANGGYPRRQVELIAEVEAGIHTPEQAYLILQAEYEAKRMQGALTIANAGKRKRRK